MLRSEVPAVVKHGLRKLKWRGSCEGRNHAFAVVCIAMRKAAECRSDNTGPHNTGPYVYPIEVRRFMHAARAGRWSHARLLPGAARLLGHLRSHGVLIGMATSTPRATYVAKTAAHPEVAASFQTVQCGDEARLRVITSRFERHCCR